VALAVRASTTAAIVLIPALAYVLALLSTPAAALPPAHALTSA
jgi:hypothetical protein